MITTILLLFLTGMMKLLYFVIPNWFLPDNMLDSFDFIITETIKLNNVLPVVALFNCISTILFFNITVFLFNTIYAFITLLRGGGGASPLNK